jgi:hypothetical protein
MCFSAGLGAALAYGLQKLTPFHSLQARRRSSQENRLSPRTQITYIDETPELKDETARGKWLDSSASRD